MRIFAQEFEFGREWRWFQLNRLKWNSNCDVHAGACQQTLFLSSIDMLKGRFCACTAYQKRVFPLTCRLKRSRAIFLFTAVEADFQSQNEKAPKINHILVQHARISAVGSFFILFSNVPPRNKLVENLRNFIRRFEIKYGARCFGQFIPASRRKFRAPRAILFPSLTIISDRYQSTSFMDQRRTSFFFASLRFVLVHNFKLPAPSFLLVTQDA